MNSKTYKLLAVFLILLSFNNIKAQELLPTNYWFTEAEAKSVKLKFDLVNNTIRIPAMINGSKDTMYFIVDSGLKIPLIMNKGKHNLGDIKYARDMVIKGMGMTDSLVVKTSYENFFRLPGLININEYINIVDKDLPFLTTSSGFEINGLIGYSLLKGFVIDINYYKKEIIFYRHNQYKKRKWFLRKDVTLPLDVSKGKAYVTIKVQNNKGEMVDVKLLIDTGYSQALWLDEDKKKGIVCPSTNIPSIMGRGLSGDVVGRVANMPMIEIGDISMKNVLVAYPDSLQYDESLVDSTRMGSLGGEFLRRYRLILNYKDKEVTFVKNPDFKDKYLINKTGMIIEKPMIEYPVFVVTKVIKKSPAGKAGIKPGDIIVAIEDKMGTELTINHIHTFMNTSKKELSIILNRDDEKIAIKLKLPGDIFKK